ncbi:MAG: outer membrane beta-barrel protein [Pseudomonadota bacterium]
MKKVLAAVAIATLASPAVAVERPFFGLDYEMMTYEFDGGGEFNTDNVRLRFGTMLKPSWGLQADVTLGLGADSEAGMKVKTQNSYTLSGLYRLNMGKAGLYGYAGYAYVNTRSESGGAGATTEEEDGLAYGVGLDFPGFWGNSFELDYRILMDEDNYTQSGMSFGMRRFF